MYSQDQSQDIKRLKDLKEAGLKFTKESYEVYQNCMKTEATYNSAIPYGIASTVLLQYFLPKMKFRSVAVFAGGITMFLFGKVNYAAKCYLKSLAYVPDDSAKISENNFDQQKEENKHLLPFTDITEENPVWYDHDTQFESYSNESNDTSDNLQEEAVNMQQEKKRVTYDELWKQYRMEQAQNTNYDSNYGTKVKLIETQKTRKRMEATSSETEFEEKELSN